MFDVMVTMRLLTLVLSILFLSINLLPAPVFAASALQRCQWDCQALTQSKAGSAYNSCVAKRCSGKADTKPATVKRTEPTQSVTQPSHTQERKQVRFPNKGKKGKWIFFKLSEDDPPYLDGYTMNTESTSRKLGFSYVCGKRGSSFFSMDGDRLKALLNPPEQVKDFTLSVDQKAKTVIKFAEYEGTLVSDKIAKQSALFKQFQKGRRLSIRFDNKFESISLKGSTAVLKTILAYCK